MKKIYLIISLFTLVFLNSPFGGGGVSFAQSTEIKPGIILPQMTTAQRNALGTNAINGMLVFDTGTQSYWFRQNGNWVNLASAATTTGWSLIGNASTDSTINYMGTSDNKSLFFRINNQPAGHIGLERSISFGRGSLAKANIGIGSGSNPNGMTDAIAIGDSALANINVSYTYFGNVPSSIAIGSKALLKSTHNLNNNIAIGYEALMKQIGSSNTGIGYQALRNNVGSFNIALGNGALLNNISGVNNLAIGVSALSNNTGSNNTAIGYLGSNINSAASNLVSVGHSASAGESSVAVGALSDASANSTAIGYATKAVNAGVSIGNETLMNNTAAGNVGVGSKVLRTSINGAYNTALGFEAGTLLTNSSGNTFIGYSSGNLLQSGNNNIFIGSNVGNNLAYSDDNIVIGSQLPTDYLSKYVKIGRDGYKYGFGLADNELPLQTLALGGGLKIKGKEAGYESYIAANATGNSIHTFLRSGGLLGAINIGDMICAGVNIGIAPNTTTTIGANNQITVGGIYYNVGINNSNPNATLSIVKRENTISNDGALEIAGTTYKSHFHYSSSEDTYIRGGKVGSKVIINDGNLGNVGIGTANPTTKLDIQGQMRLVDGSEGAGKVLTSDANGNASWQASASFAVRGLNDLTNVIPSSGYSNTGPSLYVKLDWSNTPQHQHGGLVYDPQDRSFTVPTSGVYLVNAKVGHDAGFANGGLLYLAIFRDNSRAYETRYFDGGGVGGLITAQITASIYFNAGQKIDFRVAQFSYDELNVLISRQPVQTYCSITKISN